MKFALKLVAASLALAAASQAGAALNGSGTSGSVGGPELYLTVWDSVGQKSYVRDLGISFNDFLPAANLGVLSGLASKLDKSSTGVLVSTQSATNAGTYAFGATLSGTGNVSAGSVLTSGYTLTLGADPLLASYLGLGTGLQWAVVSVDGTNNGAVNGYRLLTTSNDAVVTASNSQLSNVPAATATFISSNNAIASIGSVNNGSAGVDKSTGGFAYFDANAAGVFQGNFGGNTSFSNLANLGTKQKFWYLGASSATLSDPASVQQYTGATWSLNADGTLVYQVAVAAVPEADTWAMFAAGLLVVGAIARRRLQA